MYMYVAVDIYIYISLLGGRGISCSLSVTKPHTQEARKQCCKGAQGNTKGKQKTGQLYEKQTHRTHTQTHTHITKEGHNQEPKRGRNHKIKHREQRAQP